MSDTATIAEYRAAVYKDKQMPAVKVDLISWLQDRFGDELVSEYRFHPVRKFRFDFCVPRLMLAIEYNGMYQGAAHTSLKGADKDHTKLNLAQTLGWIVVQVNARSLREGDGYDAIEAAVAARTVEGVVQ